MRVRNRNGMTTGFVALKTKWAILGIWTVVLALVGCQSRPVQMDAEHGALLDRAAEVSGNVSLWGSEGWASQEEVVQALEFQYEVVKYLRDTRDGRKSSMTVETLMRMADSYSAPKPDDSLARP